MKKLTCKKIKEMIKDEEKESNGYRKYELLHLARDEEKHIKHLQKLETKIC